MPSGKNYRHIHMTAVTTRWGGVSHVLLTVFSGYRSQGDTPEKIICPGLCSFDSIVGFCAECARRHDRRNEHGLEQLAGSGELARRALATCGGMPGEQLKI